MNATEPAHPHDKRVGEQISDARKALGLELEDIAERTRIPLRHLKAIEASDYNILPATTYSAGFVKSFAQMVGLDGPQIASNFRAERGETGEARIEYTPFEPADPSRVPPRLLAAIGIATAIFLAIAYGLWRNSGGTETRLVAANETTTAAMPQTKRPPAAIPAVAQPISAETPVVLTATEAVWIKVSEKGGPTLFMGELAPGQTYPVPTDAKDPRLLTGRPQSLQARIGDRTLTALGEGERTIKDVSLKAPALLERAAARPPKAPTADTGRAAATAPPATDPSAIVSSNLVTPTEH